MKSSKLKLASIILAVVLCLLVLSAPAGAVVQPNSDFYVLDNENVLSAETEKYIIDRNLNLVSNCKGAQVCVVVTDSTNGQDIEEYATELFNAWGIGSKTEDNGVLILFLTDDDKYWIMPGIGLERVLTERVLRQIIDDDCEPSFARKDYDSAAKATFIAINQVVCNYYSQDPNGSVIRIIFRTTTAIIIIRMTTPVITPAVPVFHAVPASHSAAQHAGAAARVREEVLWALLL